MNRADATDPLVVRFQRLAEESKMRKFIAALALMFAACGGGSPQPDDGIVFTPSSVVLGGTAIFPSITEPNVLTSDGSFGIRSFVAGPIGTVRVTESNHRTTTFGAGIFYMGKWESHDDFLPGLLLIEAWAFDGTPFIAVFDYQPGISESLALRLDNLWL